MEVLDVYARLVNVELEANSGSNWFQEWVSLLEITDGKPVQPEMLDIARRLDAILTAVNDKKSDVSKIHDKRTIDQVNLDASLEPDQKRTEISRANSFDESAPVQPKASVEDLAVQKSEAQDDSTSEVQIEVKSEPVPTTSEKVATDKAVTLQTTSATTAEPKKDNLPAEQTPSISPKDEATSKPPEPVQEPAKVNKLTAFLQTVEPPAPAPTTASAAAKSASSSEHISPLHGFTSTVSTSPKPASPKPASPKPSTPTTKATVSSPSSPLAKPAPASPQPKTVAPSSPSSTVSKVQPPLSPATSAAKSSAQTTVRPPSSSTPTSEASKSNAPAEVKKTSEGGHMEISKEAYDLFQEIKIRKKHRYIIFRINNWGLELVKVGARSATFEDFMNELPFSDCRYAVYDHESLKSDQYGSRKAEKVFLITWQPVPAPTQLKMLYSTERKTVNGVFTGVEEIVATKRDDIMYATGTKDKYAQEDSEDEERGGKDDWMDD